MDEVTVGLAALERTPLFAGLEREHLEDVLRVGRRVSYDAGQAIVERGDPGDAMYIVVSGAAEVDVGGRFHRLEQGDFFGEMAVLAGKPREATVKAAEPVEALRIPADDLQAFLLQDPRVAVGMLKSLVERLREVQDRLDTWIGGVW
jgi:CRP-like cAMP-binding protein